MSEEPKSFAERVKEFIRMADTDVGEAYVERQYREIKSLSPHSMLSDQHFEELMKDIGMDSDEQLEKYVNDSLIRLEGIEEGKEIAQARFYRDQTAIAKALEVAELAVYILQKPYLSVKFGEFLDVMSEKVLSAEFLMPVWKKLLAERFSDLGKEGEDEKDEDD